MKLIISDEFKNAIIDEIKNTKSEIQIITAYCKLDAIQYINSLVNEYTKNKKILVRLQYQDIVSGATDIDIYPYCKAQNWSLYFRFDLHAKTYIFDKKRCIIGSANLTNKGIGLNNAAFNSEISTLFDLSEEDYMKVTSLFNNAVLMNDDIYSAMKECLNNQNDRELLTNDWSDEIKELFSPKITVLFAEDFPSTLTPTQFDNITTLYYFRSYHWLIQIIKNKINKEIYFGELIQLIHNIIVKDPLPYRKDIKIYLHNLLTWIQYFNVSEVVIDCPNISQRVRLSKR